jgi:two-component system response regulator RegA
MRTPGPADPSAGAIVLADAPGSYRQRLADGFAERHFQVIQVDSRELLLDTVALHQHQLIVLELQLGGVPTFDLVGPLRRQYPQSAIVVTALCGSIAAAVRSIREGALDFLIKPVTADQILSSLAPDGVTPVEHPSLDRAIWEYLQQCVQRAGSIAEAARRLGLHRRSLRRMLQSTPPVR